MTTNPSISRTLRDEAAQHRLCQMLGLSKHTHPISFFSERSFEMRKSITTIAIAVALFGAAPAMAETVKKGLVACVSEELLDEIIGYVSKKDNSGFMQLLMSGQCTILKEGEQVSVVSPGFMTATIRYRGVKMFTPSEAVR